MGWFSDLFLGKKSKIKKKKRYSPLQEQAEQDFFGNPITNDPLYQSGSNFLQQLLGGGPNAFADFEAPYLQQFNQQIVPGIAERFAGVGAGSSSGLNQALSSAASGLQNQLAGLHGQLKMQALPQALQYAQQPYSNLATGMGFNPYEFMEQPGGAGLLHHLAQGLGQGVGGGFKIG